MGTVLPFPSAVPGGQARQISFERAELKRIVDLYGRMVAAGLWKDYAIEFAPGAAAFQAFRRAAERPEYRIEKRQGQWALIGESGQMLKRAPALGPILAPIERRLLKVVAN
ncbi:MAG: hypothetical protein QOG13_2743 [Sphingomonadales bacterium]|jgi:hypothetical protein|nr:hypothetical protein [Sphingomonadales bacterium]MEA3043488.1 hypothetical protein [Sphingomonadales bacterium]